MFERRHEQLLPQRKFLRRLVKFALISVGLIIISLVIGMAGYFSFEGLSWVDAFLNAAMLMGGMGQINSLQTDSGKIFAGIYALYCGMVLLIAVGGFVASLRFLRC